MKLKSISFENYKAFKEKQTLEIRPITLLIGKNSSGKSAVAKLFTLLENSLSGKIREPLLLNNNGVELGAEFLDLVYGKNPIAPISFTVNFDEADYFISVDILKPIDDFYPVIVKWEDSFILYQRNREIINKNGINGVEIKSFSGIVPNKMGVYPISFDDTKFELDYIGPFRILPKRVFDIITPISSEKTGIQGENAYNYLIKSAVGNKELIRNVGQWYKNHLGGWELQVDSIDERKTYFQFLLSKENEYFEVNLADTGQGMSQVLPLVVRAFQKVEDSIVVLEQPELHLHPAAHADLAELFAKSAKENSQSFIIETHSENMLLRLRKLVVENDFGFTKDDIIIYWVDAAEHGGQQLNPITIDEEGTLSDWPEGVFTEDVAEFMEMRKIVRNKKRKKADDSEI